jgi:hypothetical protein
MTRTFGPSTYSPEILASLNQAYREVWALLYSNIAENDEIVKELGIALSQTLADLVTAGVTDVETLRRRALETMVLRAR